MNTRATFIAERLRASDSDFKTTEKTYYVTRWWRTCGIIVVRPGDPRGYRFSAPRRAVVVDGEPCKVGWHAFDTKAAAEEHVRKDARRIARNLLEQAQRLLQISDGTQEIECEVDE